VLPLFKTALTDTGGRACDDIRLIGCKTPNPVVRLRDLSIIGGFR
jgi:hypothetical protein